MELSKQQYKDIENLFERNQATIESQDIELKEMDQTQIQYERTIRDLRLEIDLLNKENHESKIAQCTAETVLKEAVVIMNTLSAKLNQVDPTYNAKGKLVGNHKVDELLQRFSEVG